ncbi:DoxX family protein [Halarchaeum sp. CBA1220]|uniref:DoxX family protein n=1 Tax=Halarchaeum sp. CBA1220 TaxID=1853682 RepID=UPI000F3A9D41|nr:DoxX family protein [Halarchaeum sp. CBA1220]QLC32794.1 DoxX family protein [Halarchaeum sp. CBA1220]
MADTDATGAPSRLGRLLFAGGLTVLAALNLKNLDGRIAYADAKGVPAPTKLVPAASALLLGGSLGIASWTRPKLSAGSIATFFVGVTPLMHDFWNAEDGVEDELMSFLQNLAVLGAAVSFFRRASRD